MLYLPRILCECFWRSVLKMSRYTQSSLPSSTRANWLDDHNLILVLFTFVWPGIYEIEFFHKLFANVYRVAQRVCIGTIILMLLLAVGCCIWYDQVSLQIVDQD
jgi:hypothetical protein